jgi:hypothetical protein
MKKVIFVLFFFSLSSNFVAGTSFKEKEKTKVVSGRVIDNSGELLAGTKITIVETGETFFTDFNGNFKINFKTDKSYTLSINNLGHQPLDILSSKLSVFTDISLLPIE